MKKSIYRLLFFITTFLSACLTQAQSQMIVDEIDNMSSILSPSDMDAFNTRLQEIKNTYNYKVHFIFQETPIRVTSYPSELTPQKYQDIGVRIKKACKKDFDDLPIEGTGTSMKKNIAVYFSFKFFNKPDKNGSLDNFFAQTIIMHPTVKSYIKTGMSTFQQDSKLIAGQNNLSSNAEHIDEILDKLEVLMRESANMPDDNFQFGPLVVTIPASAITENPNDDRTVNGERLTKRVCSTATFVLKLKTTQYDQVISTTIENAIIQYYYSNNSGAYDQVQITLPSNANIFLSEVNVLKFYVKSLQLNVTNAGVFSGNVTIAAPVEDPIKLSSLYTLKPGVSGTMLFTYTSGTTNFSGLFNCSNITNVKVEVAKFNTVLASLQGNLDQNGTLTQTLSTSNKSCSGIFYEIDFNNFSANISYSIFSGITINSCTFDGALGSIAGLTGKVGFTGSIDASGNVVTSIKQENTNLAVCGAIITNLSGGISLDRQLDFKFVEASCHIRHEGFNTEVNISKIYFDPQGLIEFDGGGSVEYESFTFNLSQLSYSQRSGEIVCAATVRLNVTGVDANFHVSDFRITKDGIIIGEVGGDLIVQNFIDMKFLVKYTKENNFSRFSGFYDGNLIGTVKIAGTLDITKNVSPDFISVYVKLGISTTPGRGIPLGPLPIDIFSLSGEFGYNYRIDFGNTRRDPARPGTPVQDSYIAGLGIGLSVRGGIASLNASPVIQVSRGNNPSVDIAFTGNINVPAEDEWFQVNLAAKYSYPSHNFIGGIEFDFDLPKNNGALINSNNLGLDFKFIKPTVNNPYNRYFWYLGRRNMNLTLIRVLTLSGDIEFMGLVDDPRTWSAYLKGTTTFDFNWYGQQNVTFLSYEVARAEANVRLYAMTTCSLAVSKQGVSGMMGMAMTAAGAVKVVVLPEMNLSWTTFSASVLGEISGSLGFQNTTIKLNGHLRAAASVCGETGEFSVDLAYTYSPEAGSSSSVTTTSSTYTAPAGQIVYTPNTENTLRAGDITAIRNEFARRAANTQEPTVTTNPFARYRTLSANLTQIKSQQGVTAAIYTSYENNLKQVAGTILTKLDKCNVIVLKAFLLHIKTPSNLNLYKPSTTADQKFDDWMSENNYTLSPSNDDETWKDFPVLKSNIEGLATAWGENKTNTFKTKLVACGDKVRARLNGVTDARDILRLLEVFLADNSNAVTEFSSNFALFEEWLQARGVIPDNVDTNTEWLKYPKISKHFPTLKTNLSEARYKQAVNSFLQCGPTVLQAFNAKAPPLAVVQTLAIHIEGNYKIPAQFKSDIANFNTWYEANKSATTPQELTESDIADDAASTEDAREKLFSSRINPPDDYFVLTIHGSGSNFIFNLNGRLIEATHRTLIRYLDDQDLEDKKILLLSCSDLTSAKNLANKLGQSVIATDGWVRIYSDGGLRGMNRNGNGTFTTWVECKPGNQTVSIPQPRAPGSGVTEFVQMGGVIDEVEDLLARKVNITSLANPPNGYIFFNKNGRKSLKRIDVSSGLKQLTVDENGIVIEFTGYQRLSQPGALADNLGTPPNQNHQAHHIIPDAVVQSHWFYQAVRARQEVGYNLDRGTNGLYLAITEEDYVEGISDIYPTHNGSHPKYNNAISEMLNIELRNRGITTSNINSLSVQQINSLLDLFEQKGVDIIIYWPNTKLN